MGADSPALKEAIVAYVIVKIVVSAVLIAIVSETAKRSPSLGALIASLPLVSLLGMIWLWRDTGDAARLAAHAEATFWYVLPSLPMFLVIPAMLRAGVPFWLALAAGVVLTSVLYAATSAALTRFGVAL